MQHDDSLRPVAVPVTLTRKGRGAVSNIAHRFESVVRERDSDAAEAECLEHCDLDDEALPALATSTTFETAKSLITYNESPDIGFDRSVNPYRGCEHGCIYCFARPTHSYLNLSPGLDFETKLVAKRNAVALLQRELAAPGYRAAVIALGVITDAYQPIERELKLTRGVVEVLTRTRHPFGLITKSSLIERDIDLLAPAAAEGIVAATISITTLDHSLSRILEPRAASPTRRLRTVRTLAAGGIPVTVNVAPIIPFVNEPEIERVLEAAAEAGARQAHYTLLRLPWEVAPLFIQWLEAHFPDRAERVMNRLREMRGGKNYDSQFGKRMTGEGTWAALIRQRFEKAAAKLRLNRELPPLRNDLFRAPRSATPQLNLFG
ncbi:MAG: PA0069 family radical SAM protein [Pseudomonadota bacterium]|nr:PA0069 family radical SAM protein [Burkholderiaceae bacterium]MDQ3445846.1 PA0069 family radical SAM protein [Pseudomonadota bacterium]